MPDMPMTLELVLAEAYADNYLTAAEGIALGTELARLREVAWLAAEFHDIWRAGDGSDADTCDAADALRDALREGGTDG